MTAVDERSGAIVPGAAPPPAKPPSQSMQQLRRRLATLLIGIPVPIVLILLWHVGVERGWELPFGIRMAYLPLPGDVGIRLWDFAFGGLVDDAYSGTLWEHLIASAGRVAWGFGVAALLAVPLGVLMGRYRLINNLLDLTVNVVRPIPGTAWVPLVMLIIGIGAQATAFLITIAAFFPILLNTISGVRQTPARLTEAALMLGTSRFGVLLKVVLPAAAPSVMSGLRVALGLAWVMLVLGESNGINTGLGATIQMARDLNQTALIVVGMLVIGFAGLLSDKLLTLLFRMLTRNRPLVVQE